MLDVIFETRDQLAEIIWPLSSLAISLTQCRNIRQKPFKIGWRRNTRIVLPEPNRFLEYHVMQQGTQVYNNLLSTGKWRTDFLRDQQILALTTRCEALEQGHGSSKEPTGKQPAKESVHRDKHDKNPNVAVDDPAFAGMIEPWRFIKDGTTKEDSSEKNGPSATKVTTKTT